MSKEKQTDHEQEDTHAVAMKRMWSPEGLRARGRMQAIRVTTAKTVADLRIGSFINLGQEEKID